MNAVEVYLQQSVSTPIDEKTWQIWFEIWLEVLSIHQSCELSLCLTTDEAIQTLNREFRGIDAATDVLAFAAQETMMPAGILALTEIKVLGDIIISVPTATRQALEHRHSLTQELAWLAVHGLLHLLGWDHPDEVSLQHMLQKQQQLLQATPDLEPVSVSD